MTDAFDAFHRVIAVLWHEFGPLLAGPEGAGDGVGFDELVDQLELDVFLPACARLLREATGEAVEPDEIAARIRLLTDSGEFLAGAAGRYHSHAFHPDSPEHDVPNAILTSSLMSLPRAGLRLQIGPPPEHRRGSSRRNLPVH